MYRRSRQMQGLGSFRRMRGLGDTAIVLANGMRVSGSSPSSMLRRPAVARTVTRTVGTNIQAGCPQTTMDAQVCSNQGGTMITGPAPCYTKACQKGSGTWALPAGSVVSNPAPARRPIGFQRPGGGGQVRQSQNNALNLAQLQSIAQTNPSSLTQGQWAQLQAAGTIPNTLPYSSASQLATALPTTADDTSLSTVSTDLSTTFSNALNTTYGPFPLWGWLVAGGAAWLFLGKHRR
jgi:hypothetical protein